MTVQPGEPVRPGHGPGQGPGQGADSGPFVGRFPGPFGPPPRTAGPPARRPQDVASYLVGAAGLASVITVLVMTVSAVMSSGSVRGTGGAFTYVVLGGLVFAFLAGRSAFRLRAPGVVVVSWPLTLAAVGVTFLVHAFAPPGGSFAPGWLLTGLVLLALAAAPVVLVVLARRTVKDAQRNLTGLMARAARQAGRTDPRVVDGDVVDPPADHRRPG